MEIRIYKVGEAIEDRDVIVVNPEVSGRFTSEGNCSFIVQGLEYPDVLVNVEISRADCEALILQYNKR